MSSKDDKADLSDLKSRLGLKKNKKSGGGAESAKSSGPQKSQKTGDGGAGASKPAGGGGASKKSSKKSSGGVDDRLAALKKSTLGTKAVEKKEEQPQSQQPQRQSGGQPAPAGGQSAGASGGAEPAGGGAAQQTGGGQQTAGQRGATGQQNAGAAGGAGMRQGPPPGAQGPPPTAMAPPTQNQKPGGSNQSQSTAGKADSGTDPEDVDLDDIDLGEIGVDDDSILSGPVLVLLGVLLVVGLIFGFLASQSMQTRDIEQARINDATSLQENLEPRLEEFDQAAGIIEGMDPTRVDFEAVEQLGALEFVIDARVLPGNRILLSDSIIRPLNRYMGESSVLAQLIAQHRAVTEADREELEAFMEEVEEIGEDQQVAAFFDLMNLRRHMAQVAQGNAEPGEYIPPRGRLVKIPEDFEELEPDEEGMVEVEVVASGSTSKIDIQALVPVVFTDFIDVETGNALQRYQQRVEQLQQYVDELSGTVPVLREQIDETASADPPPLLTIVSSSDDEDDEEDPLADETPQGDIDGDSDE